MLLQHGLFGCCQKLCFWKDCFHALLLILQMLLLHLPAKAAPFDLPVGQICESALSLRNWASLMWTGCPVGDVLNPLVSLLD